MNDNIRVVYYTITSTTLRLKDKQGFHLSYISTLCSNVYNFYPPPSMIYIFNINIFFNNDDKLIITDTFTWYCLSVDVTIFSIKRLQNAYSCFCYSWQKDLHLQSKLVNIRLWHIDEICKNKEEEKRDKKENSIKLQPAQQSLRFAMTNH